MLATACPSCGVPVALALGQPGFSCHACGTEGALPHTVTLRLDAARTELEQHDAAERQLGRGVRHAVGKGRLLEGVFLGANALLLFPLLVLIVVNVIGLFTEYGGDWAIALSTAAGLTPMVFLLFGTASLAWVLMRRARLRVATAAAAVPADRPGTSVRCHVCGGPLDAGLEGVVRCSYCSADNVVDAAIVARASGERVAVLDDYAAAVAQQSSGVARAFGCGSGVLIAVVAVTPFVCVVPTWMFMITGWVSLFTLQLLLEPRQPPTPGMRYGLVSEGERQCVAWFNPYVERWQRRRLTLDGRDIEIEAADVEEVSLDALVGRTFIDVVEDGGRILGAKGVAVDPRAGWYFQRGGRRREGPDVVTLRQDPDPTFSAGLWRLCVDE